MTGKKLYIVGNGFDLAHGFRTSYRNFYDWLKQNGKEGFIESMEIFFSKWADHDKDLLWNDFERALGECDLEESYNICTEASQDVIGETDRFLREINDSIIVNFVNPLKHDMPLLFAEWIKHVNKQIQEASENARILTLDEDGLFLTFNYTDTLEEVYKIPSNQICHIHNRVSVNEKPIVGHNHKFQIVEHYDMTIGERNEKKRLEDVLNGLIKQYRFNIKQHRKFFEKINTEIDAVIIFGHSLGDIDMPYFKWIKMHVNSNAKWHILWHYDKDIKRIGEVLKLLKLPQLQIEAFRL